MTKPPKAMLETALTSDLGDDVFMEDPTVIKLEQRCAEILKKEAALFFPTGVMANQVAILTHTDGKRGYEIIIGNRQHISLDERGSAALLSGVQLRNLPQNSRGEMSLKQIESVIRKDPNNYTCVFPATRLICVENTWCGNAVSLEYMKEVRRLADENGLGVHLDGARLFNAALALKVEPSDIAALADSVQFCLSKGLCCPLGSMLVGTKEFIIRARKFRKIIGGGMRQVGIYAGFGLYALEHIRPLLSQDHEKARKLHDFLTTLPEIEIQKYEEYSSNMIWFKFTKKEYNLDPKAADFKSFMKTQGITINMPFDSVEPNNYFRFVFHQMISFEDVELIKKAIQDFIAQYLQ